MCTGGSGRWTVSGETCALDHKLQLFFAYPLDSGDMVVAYTIHVTQKTDSAKE